MKHLPLVGAALAACLLPACERDGSSQRDAPSATASAAVSTKGDAPHAEEATWLVGSTETRFALVEKHLRGFDMTMVETGYRYVELYWAGEDRNWPFASYQLDKIETTIANGLERRPKRAASARLLTPAIASMRKALEAEDAEAFAASFATLTETCNACHRAEKVAFIEIRPPKLRLSPVYGVSAGP